MKSIGKGVGFLGGIVAASYLALTGFNYLVNHRTEIYSRNECTISRIHGPFSHTEYIHRTYYEGIEDKVNQVSFFGSRSIVDEVWGKKGLVDKIDIVGPIWSYYSRRLRRDEDYDTHKEEFDKADKLLAETKERFKEYFE